MFVACQRKLCKWILRQRLDMTKQVSITGKNNSNMTRFISMTKITQYSNKKAHYNKTYQYDKFGLSPKFYGFSQLA